MNNLLILIFLCFLLVSVYYYLRLFSKFKKYQDIKTKISGIDIIRKITDDNNMSNLYVVKAKGINTNYYNSSRNVIYLTDNIFDDENLVNNMKALMLGSLAVISQKKPGFINLWNQLFLMQRYFVLAGYFFIILGYFGNINNSFYLGMLLVMITVIMNVIFLSVNNLEYKKAIDFIKNTGVIDNKNKDAAIDILGELAYQYLAMPITAFMMLFNK